MLTVAVRPTVAAAIVIASMLGSCSSGADVADPATLRNPSPSSSTTSARCDSGVELVADPVARADLDGDGSPDDIVIVGDGETWQIGAELSAGGSVARALSSDPGTDVRVLSSIDLDGDGALSVAVVIGGGASNEVFVFVTLVDCSLEVVSRTDGSPATFLTGSSTANVSAVLCRSDDAGSVIEQYEFALVDGGADEPIYQGTVRSFLVDDGVVIDEGASGGARLTPGELAAIDLFACGEAP